MGPAGGSRQRVESGPSLTTRANTLVSWATLAALVLLALGGAAARPDGIALAAPGAAAAALAVAALALLWRLAEGKAPRAAAGLAFVPLLLIAWPAAPGVRALSGSPLLVPALAAAALLLAREPPRWSRAAFLPVVALLYLGVAARTQFQVGAEGDEPHYLMVSESLLRDHDLALDRDYEEGRYRAFYRTQPTLAPHFRVRGREGRIYSLHALGLSLLVLPAYALGGYPLASFFMALLAALLAREIRELVRTVARSDALAQGVGWLVALSPPLAHYAGLIFTEVPAALVVAWVLRKGSEAGVWSWSEAARIGLALAALPWLNVRYAPIAAILLLYVLAARPSRAGLAGLVLPALASAAAIAAYHFVLYGFLDPRRVYGVRREFSASLLPEGLAGMLFDQEFGLLAYAPFFALAVPGLVGLWRSSRRLTIVVGALLAVVLLTTGAWPMWRGGFNPPARFLLPIVPVLALAVASRLRAGCGAGPALLIGWSLFAGLGGAAEPRLVHRDRDGTAPLFREFSGAEEWTRLLPAYVLEDADRWRLTAVWAGALALAAARWRRPASPAAALGLGTLGLLAAAGIAGRLSHTVSGGRDAVRLVGRPAVVVPGWSREAGAAAEWRVEDCGWGPLYEPHRHPGGADLGQRLSLPVGRYRLELTAEELAPDLPLPILDVHPERAGPSRESHWLRLSGGLAADFAVESGERAVDLRLKGGGPLLVRGVRLALNLSGPAGSNRAERSTPAAKVQR